MIQIVTLQYNLSVATSQPSSSQSMERDYLRITAERLLFEWRFILSRLLQCMCGPVMVVQDLTVLVGFRLKLRPLTKYFLSAGAVWLEFDTDEC